MLDRVGWIMVAALFFVSLCGATALAQGRYAGRRLEEALRLLQAGGLRIVYSSEIVRPDMRVVTEPRAHGMRAVLDELLKPYHLKAEDGPGGTIKIVRAKPTEPAPASVRPPDSRSKAKNARHTDDAAGLTTYIEHVAVTAPLPRPHEPAVGSEMSVARADLPVLSSAGGADDPMRAVQAMPFAAASDDFGTELSVRGSPYQQAAVVIDGVATPWLRHAMYGTSELASLGMVNSLVVENATLRAGVYPHRYDNRLGPQIDLTLREGSRTSRHWRAVLGVTDATVAGEGPLGSDRRGSWLIGLRQSYREWPNTWTADFSGKAFGFSDGAAKLVHDVTSRHQVSFTALAGRSVIDERGNGGPDDLAVAANHAAMLNFRWRSTFASNTVLNQQLSLVTHNFNETDQRNREITRSADKHLSYRASVTRKMRSGVLDGGIQTERVDSLRFLTPDIASVHPHVLLGLQPGEELSGSSWLRSGFAHFTWMPAAHLTLAPGARFTDSTLLDRRAVSRWILSEWSLGRWTLHASAGVSHQFPEIDQTLVGGLPNNLKPQRAVEFDTGVERRVTESTRWQATLFRRDEHDGLREPDMAPRFIRGILTDPLTANRYQNALSASSHGVELLVQHSSSMALSGWIAYAYGSSRYHDVERGERYWGDFDQRHGFNAAAIYRVSVRTMLSVKFRGGTNFPVAGYLTAREEALFAGDNRNQVRLPAYARLDVRASRRFDYSTHRLTVFVDVLNVLNRRNVGSGNGFIDPATRQATGFTRTLLPRLPSAGVIIEF